MQETKFIFRVDVINDEKFFREEFCTRIMRLKEVREVNFEDKSKPKKVIVMIRFMDKKSGRRILNKVAKIFENEPGILLITQSYDLEALY